MKSLLILAVALFGVTNAFLSAFDTEACSGSVRTINASTPQVFDSPGFNYSDPEGSIYPPNALCEWQIFMDDPDQNELMLSFFNFSLEFVTDCRTDRVDVYEGTDDTGTLVRTLCGNLGAVVPEPIITTTRNFFVRFQSDDNGIERAGFLARVGYPLQDAACEGTGPQVFTNNAGLFLTKNFPVNYENDMVCEYLFQAPAGQRVVVGFSEFDLENCCNCDFLEIFNGDSQSSPNMGRWYDNDLPARITSSSNNLYMRFEADFSITFQGFFGFYRFIDA